MYYMYGLGKQMTDIVKWYTLLHLFAGQTLWKIPYKMMYSAAKLLGFSHTKLASFCVNFSFPGVSCSSDFTGTCVCVEKTVYVNICRNWVFNVQKHLCQLYVLDHSTSKCQSLGSARLAPSVVQGKAMFAKAAHSQSFSSLFLRLLNAGMILESKMSI